MRRWMMATGMQPTSIESRNTTTPIEPITTGTRMAENDSKQTPSNANLNGSPSRLKRFDSLTTSTSTRNSRNANETSTRRALEEEQRVHAEQRPEQEVHGRRPILEIPALDRGHRLQPAGGLALVEEDVQQDRPGRDQIDHLLDDAEPGVDAAQGEDVEQEPAGEEGDVDDVLVLLVVAPQPIDRGGCGGRFGLCHRWWQASSLPSFPPPSRGRASEFPSPFRGRARVGV